MQHSKVVKWRRIAWVRTRCSSMDATILMTCLSRFFFCVFKAFNIYFSNKIKSWSAHPKYTGECVNDPLNTSVPRSSVNWIRMGNYWWISLTLSLSFRCIQIYIALYTFYENPVVFHKPNKNCFLYTTRNDCYINIQTYE